MSEQFLRGTQSARIKWHGMNTGALIKSENSIQTSLPRLPAGETSRLHMGQLNAGVYRRFASIQARQSRELRRRAGGGKTAIG